MGEVSVYSTDGSNVASELKNIPSLRLDHFDGNKLSQWLNETGRSEVKSVRRKLLENVRFVSEQEFHHTLVSQKFAEFPQDPYAVMFDINPGSSKRWVFQTIHEHLQNQPDASFYPNSKHAKRNMRMMREKDISNFVFFDDCAYTARQIQNATHNIVLCCAEISANNPNFYFHIPYITSFAQRRLLSLQEIKINESGGLTAVLSGDAEIIPSVREILSPDEISILGSIHDAFISDVYLNSTLTYFGHKIADPLSFEFSIKECMVHKPTLPYRAESLVRQEQIEYERMLSE